MKTVKAIHVSNIDNTVTITESADAGDTIVFLEDDTEKTIIARGSTPIWHKIATKPVEKGGSIFKYGSVIGLALENIKEGDHVHTHNTASPGIGG